MKAPKGTLLAGAVALIFCASCRNEAPTRSYEEKSGAAASQTSAAAERDKRPVTGGAWRWKKPETWTQEKGTAMRAATFRIPGGKKEAECTIIPLAGEAGGIRANIKRWLDQLALPPMAEKDLERFLDASEKWTSADGWPALAFDFTTLEPSDSASVPISGMAAMIRTPGETVFIKMTGDRDRIIENRERFLALCRSIRKGSE
jgi:hypothetical protein